MSSGLYTHTTRATGTVLTSTIYNGDHTNHITNQNPSMTGAYSDNVAQMQSVVSPGGVGSESLALSLAGELERLRFAIKTMHGGAQWYAASQLLGTTTTLGTIAGNTTLTSADVATLKNITATADVTLPDAATLSNGQAIRFKSATENRVRILPQGTDTIDGDAEYLLPSYCNCEIMRTAAGAYSLTQKPDYEVGMLYPSQLVGKTTKRGFAFPDGTAYSRTTKGGLFYATSLTATVTVTIATPGVFTWTNNKLQNNDPVEFSTTGALPTGIVAGTTYFVVNNATDGADKFRVSASIGGAAINTTGSQSGIHTGLHVPYGRGDGSTTFNILDIRGAGPIGRDGLGGTAAGRITVGGSGINGDTPGQRGGAETVAVSVAQEPSHAHPGSSGSGSVTTGPGGGSSGVPTNGGDALGTSAAVSVSVNVAAQGGGAAHNNMHPVQVTNWMVKT